MATCGRLAQKQSVPILFPQALEVVQSHPETLAWFLRKAEAWIQGPEEVSLFPAKYVDTFLSCRRLCRHFLEFHQAGEESFPFFYSRQYEALWQAAKHGFYKAALKKEDRSVYRAACDLLSGLFEEEIAAAKSLLTKNNSSVILQI